MKFDFVHQTVSRWEAHAGGARDGTCMHMPQGTACENNLTVFGLLRQLLRKWRATGFPTEGIIATCFKV